MKNLSFTEFRKDFTRNKMKGQQKQKWLKLKHLLTFALNKKISLAEAEQKQMELLEEKNNSMRQKLRTINKRCSQNVLNYLKGSIDLENLTNILEGEILDEI